MSLHGLAIVIPGRREAANPESILPESILPVYGYGFRVRPFGPSRNDSVIYGGTA